MLLLATAVPSQRAACNRSHPLQTAVLLKTPCVGRAGGTGRQYVSVRHWRWNRRAQGAAGHAIVMPTQSLVLLRGRNGVLLRGRNGSVWEARSSFRFLEYVVCRHRRRRRRQCGRLAVELRDCSYCQKGRIRKRHAGQKLPLGPFGHVSAT